MPERRILIAVDGSREAREAIAIGLELAIDRGAAVTFVHVAPVIADEVYDIDPVHGPTQEQVAAADPVLREALVLAAAKGVDASINLVGATRQQPPLTEIADTIVGVAEGIEADLIVIGSRGHGALANALLGSVSQGVLERAPTAVVVARPPLERAV